MIANWFEARIKYVKVGEDGRERKVSEMYLIDATSYTEAETRLVEAFTGMFQGDFYIAGLKKSNITEIVETRDGNDDKWFKATVAIIDCDGISGREKKSNTYFLVAGADIDRALENLQKSLSSYVIPFDIVSLADTAFMDVFPYLDNQNEDGLDE